MYRECYRRANPPASLKRGFRLPSHDPPSQLPASESAGLIETGYIELQGKNDPSYRRANPPASLKHVASITASRNSVSYRRANPPASLKRIVDRKAAVAVPALPASESAGLIETSWTVAMTVVAGDGVTGERIRRPH